MLLIQRLIWDEWNVAYIARHAVVPDEVEEVCHGDPIVQEGHTGRSLIIGPSANGRMLTVVIDPMPENEGVYYVVTARPASRRERIVYSVEKQGGSE